MFSGRRAIDKAPHRVYPNYREGIAPHIRLMHSLSGKKILLGVTGGIAAYKACEVVRLLVKCGAEVQVVMTANAREFVSPLTFQTLSKNPVPAGTFDQSWESDIGHIALADSADLVLVAPATANFIAKAAHGLADGLLTTLLLATRAPVIVCPAMNVNMYTHAAVQENIATLRARGVGIIEPAEGELACGWEGQGRLEEPAAIIDHVEKHLSGHDLTGDNVLVTAGATREFIDSARLLSNPSTGKMGFAIAREAWLRGAEVILVAGHTEVPTPTGVERVDAISVNEMRDAVISRLPWATIVVKAAAVSDYAPVSTFEGKAKKGAPELNMKLRRTPDILREVGEKKDGRFVVGFAAESDELLHHAREKLEQKNADLIVANDITRPDSGFGTDTNAVVLVDGKGGAVELPLLPKTEVAARLFDRVLELRS